MPQDKSVIVPLSFMLSEGLKELNCIKTFNFGDILAINTTGSEGLQIHRDIYNIIQDFFCMLKQ